MDEVQQQLIDLAGDNAPILQQTEQTEIEVLDENAQAVDLFHALFTKWDRQLAIGMSGGVDVFYCIKPDAIRLELDMNYPKCEHKALYNKLMVMERVALPLLNQRD